MLSEQQTKPERAPGLPWQEIGGKVLLLQPAQRFAHELNPVASMIWKLADGSNTFESIVGNIVDAFDVDPTAALEDTTAFLRELEEKNLLL